MKKIPILFALIIFLQLKLFPQQLPNVKNSWVGNTFGLPEKHIPHNIDNIYVTPSGKVATITGWEEGGHNVAIYDNNGTQLGIPVESGTGSWGRMSGSAVFLNDNYLYQVMSQHGCDGGNGDGLAFPPCGVKWQCIRRYQLNGNSAPFTNGKGYDKSMLMVSTNDLGINGVLVYNNELYVSDVGAAAIKVYNATTMSDVVVRALSVGSAGVMDFDSKGNLWVLDQTQQKLVCFTTTGTILPQQIIFPASVKATSFCVDKVNDRILVTNNAIDQNILIYTNIFNQPTQSSTYGATGGINSGVSGEVAPLKFSTPKGVGIDNLGNIYVANNGVGAGGVRLEKYNTSNALQWQLKGLMFTDNGCIDDFSEVDVYSRETHMKVDFKNTTPGTEWSLKGMTINKFAYPEDNRLDDAFWTTAYMRNGLGKKLLFVTDMYGSNLTVHKFSAATGETAVPSAYFSEDDGKEYIWSDINNNQTHQGNEFDKMTSPILMVLILCLTRQEMFGEPIVKMVLGISP